MFPQCDIKNGISIAMKSILFSDHPRSIPKTKVRVEKLAAELKEKSSLRKFLRRIIYSRIWQKKYWQVQINFELITGVIRLHEITTKCAGKVYPCFPSPASRARTIACERSETCNLVRMLET